MGRFICPCCENFSLDEKSGSYEICTICQWEDDKTQSKDPDYKGGANKKSLNEARILYQTTLIKDE